MIKNYAFIALAFISSALFAQQQKKTSSLLSSNKQFSNNSAVNSTTHNPAYQVDYGWSTSGNGGWVLSDSTYFTYTPTCKLKTKINSENGEYVKDSLNYNETDLLSEAFIFFNEFGTWDTIQHELFTYNNVGLISQIITMANYGGVFDTTSIQTYTYNSQNKLLTSTAVSSNSGIISDGTTTTNSYDVNGNLTSVTKQFFNSGSLTWINYDKIDYFYDNNNVPTKIFDYNWDQNNSTWEIDDSTTNIVYHYWNGSFEDAKYTTFTTNEFSLDSFYYDSQDNLIQWLHYSEENGIFVLTINQVHTYSYDSNNNIIEYTYLEYYDGDSDSIPDAGLKQTFHDYVACTPASGIAGFDKNETTVLYPNPSNGILSISNHTSISKIEVYTMYGKKVYASETATKTIDLTNLSKGVYIVKLQNGEQQVATQKIILQ